jgi:carbonic anhydrase
MTFPFVQKAVESGQMQTHGAYFGVAEGSLFVLDKAAKEFRNAREMA